MTTPERPIYIDQGNGTYKLYEGTIERLGGVGWPEVLPAGSLGNPGSTNAALDHVHSRSDLKADLLTLKDPSEKDWEVFKQFLATARAD